MIIIILLTITLAASASKTDSTPSVLANKEPKTWPDLLNMLRDIIIGISSSNMFDRYREIDTLAKSACKSIPPQKTIGQLQIIEFTDNVSGQVEEGIRENVKFYLTKTLNDVLACKDS